MAALGGFDRAPFTSDELRKISLDLLDAARQLEKANPEDQCMLETCASMRRVSVMLFTYFPPPSPPRLEKHKPALN
jgi:hypothetical protein